VLVATLKLQVDLFSATIHAAYFRLHLALIAQRYMKTKQMDVTLNEILHIQQPVLIVSILTVCKLLRNLYGLKQAPCLWHKTVYPFIKYLGFYSSAGDPCFYYQWRDRGFVGSIFA